MPPALLRCEVAAVGFRQVDFTSLAPADGYLAVFAPPEALPPIATIKPLPAVKVDGTLFPSPSTSRSLAGFPFPRDCR